MSNSLKIIIVLLAVILLYGYFRYTNISKLKNEVESLDRQITQTKLRLDKYKSLKSDFINVDTISFIEKVLEIAKQEKIEKVSISQKGKGIGDKKDKLGKSVIMINLEDNYRKTSEFIRELNNLNYNFMINKIEMLSTHNGIRTNITVDLFSKGN